jgi:hypothetical protein
MKQRWWSLGWLGALGIVLGACSEVGDGASPGEDVTPSVEVAVPDGVSDVVPGGDAAPAPDSGGPPADAVPEPPDSAPADSAPADSAPADVPGEDAATADTVAADGADTTADDADPGDALLCIPACAGQDCGYDPCGNFCGGCLPDFQCDSAGACVPRGLECGDGVVGRDETCDPGPDGPIEGCGADCQIAFGSTCEGEPSVCTVRDLDEAGNLCSDPIVIEGGKFFAHLGNAGPFNSYHPWFGECRDGDFGTQSFGPDIVFAMWLEADRTVVAQIRSFVIPTTLAIATRCGDDDPTDYVLNESCVAIAQNHDLGTWSELRWTTESDRMVYVITGAAGSSHIGPFELAISHE